MSDSTYPGVYVQELPSATESVVPASTTITVFVGRTQTGAAGSVVTITSLADYASQLGPVSASLPLSLAVRDYFDNGGQTAIIVCVGGPAAPLSDAQWLATINGLAAGPAFNILALAPDVPGEDVPATVTMAAAAQCAAVGAMVILGPLASWQAAFEADTLDAISVDNLGPLPLSSRQSAAVYFPNLRVPDPVTAELITASPVGAVAGIWVTTDTMSSVWTAPAGITHGLVGAGGLTATLNDSQNQTLAGEGINALRAMPNYGLVVWGAHTLTGIAGSQDDYRYIQVRRTVTYIKASIAAALNQFVFDLDDPATWATVTQMVDGFLNGLWAQGGLVGVTPAEAYSVTCNASNNPPSSQADGIVNVTIMVALTQPAEFQVIEMQFATASPS